MKNQNEFDLSKRIQDEYIQGHIIYLEIEDVKEFIFELKESILIDKRKINKHQKVLHGAYNKFLNKINTLAGSKLVKEKKQ